MNIALFIAGVLSIIAFFAHAFIGDHEYRALKPNDESPQKHKETWVQARSGWHWVSVDLLFSGILLILISATDFIKAKPEIAMLLSLYFFICGVVWLIIVVISRNENKKIFILSQWIFCFVVSGLTFIGWNQF